MRRLGDGDLREGNARRERVGQKEAGEPERAVHERCSENKACRESVAATRCVAATVSRSRCHSVGIAVHDAPLPKSSVEERSEEHTSELQSLMRISYAVFCLKKKKEKKKQKPCTHSI